jgi:hypothetical protein
MTAASLLVMALMSSLYQQGHCGLQVPSVLCGATTIFINTTLGPTCLVGQVISAVYFAGYGNSTVSCPNGITQSTLGACQSLSALAQISFKCMNQQSCRITKDYNVFGDPCPSMIFKQKQVTYSVLCGYGGSCKYFRSIDYPHIFNNILIHLP